MRFVRLLLVLMFALAVGLALGAYLFADTRPRAFMDAPGCGDSCFKTSEINALLLSVGIQRASGFLPRVLAESDKTIVIVSPEPERRIDYLVFPKKDLGHIGDVSEEDGEYIADAYRVMAQLIREQNLQKYQIYTNGPGSQQVNYLHFHLLAR